MATDFKYAAQTDLEMYYPNFSSYDSKNQIMGWTTESFTKQDTSTVSFYVAYNSGLMSQLFIDGKSQQAGNQTIGTTKVADTSESVNAVSETVIDIDGDYGNLTVDTFIKIGNEIMYIKLLTDGSPDTMSVIRACLGTSMEAHDSGADIFEHFKPTASGHNLYDADNDFIILKYGSDPNDNLTEDGQNSSTYFDQMLVNASMELNNLLDARYPMPLPKYDVFDANTSHSTASTEYDAIIFKMTCYICISNLLRSESKMEEADYYNGLVTKAERTGMVDRLNAGEFKLAFEVDSTDSQGKVRTISKAGSMDIVETAGEWSGENYDVCRITCTTAGAYGTAVVKAETYGSDALFGTTTEDIKITGGLQHLVSGLYVRFQGASMNLSGTADSWEVTVTNENRKRTNPMTSGIELTRGARGI